MISVGKNSSKEELLSSRESPRIPGLDTLRFFAILLVLGRHIDIEPPLTSTFLTFFIHWWRSIGWIGVELFFILSGFLITNLLVKEYQKHGAIRAARFLYRRALKILPSLYVLLIFTFIASRSPLNLTSVIAEIFLFQNYHQGLWAHTWTLAIEGQFYLIITLVMVILTFLNYFTLFPVISTLIILSCALSRITSALNDTVGNFHDFAVLTHFRLDSLFTGALIGYYWDTRRMQLEFLGKKCNKYFYILLLCSMVLPACFPVETSNVMYTYGYNILALIFSVILVITLSQSPSSGISSNGKNQMMRYLSSLFEYLGKHSYPTYLWHMPVYSVCSKFAPIQDNSSGLLLYLTVIISYILLSFVVGYMMSRAIEYPILLFRGRIIP